MFIKREQELQTQSEQAAMPVAVGIFASLLTLYRHSSIMRTTTEPRSGSSVGHQTRRE